jgi:transcriptional regulator with XRE-family HTH domain
MKTKKSYIIKEEEKDRGTPDEQIRESVGRKIKQERNSRSQSAERIAKRVGISRVALTHIEKGRNNINAVQLWKLACILGCEPSDFFPSIPKGFAVTNMDYKKIAREDERAEGWARDLFSDEF